MMLRCGLALLLAGVCAAQDVCYVGYIMDTYCIDRGRLLDKGDLGTLDHPEAHTVHCLVDVGNCRNSNYEVLAPNPAQPGSHCRAYRLDDEGKRLAVAHARAGGSCSTCADNGTLVEGYRATVRGVVSDPSASPPRITVTQILDPSVGCPSGESQPANINCNAGDLGPLFAAHGAMMISSWGLLLPAGVITAKMLKHRPGALWFKMHRILQPVGLCMALAGFIIALTQFDVFVEGGRGAAKIHGILGIIVMILGLLQPINAAVRPHAPQPGEDKPLVRRVWEWVHKGCGWLAVILGFVNVALGTIVVPLPYGARFQITLGVFGGLLLLYAVGCVVDSRRAQKVAAMPNGTELLRK
eukprot:Hpha_TRINITY_DN19160_c0_g1::TRINITY_DN19160_c0_g1_i1::g.94774::m.94774